MVANELYFEFRDHDFLKHSEVTKKALKKKEEDELKKKENVGSFFKIPNFIKKIL